MRIALLISTYNWPEALELVLASVLTQSVLPDEILIADDGSNHCTRDLIENINRNSSVSIKHFWQEDNGFRKATILNKAIANTTCEYIIQIDGDCIPHSNFVEDHKRLARPFGYLYGSRVNLTEACSQRIFKSKDVKFNFLSKGLKKRGRALRVPLLCNFIYS